MRILVCGGRDFLNRAAVDAALGRLLDRYGDDLEILQGAARGADALAASWALDNEVPFISVPARWSKLDKAAGMERNRRMVERYTPKAAVAFPGGRGTAGMVSILEAAGIPVWKIGGRS